MLSILSRAASFNRVKSIARSLESIRATVKLLINALGVYLNTDLKTPAFIGDPASIRTLASSPLRLLMSVVPIFSVYVNNNLLYMSISAFISTWLAKK